MSSADAPLSPGNVRMTLLGTGTSVGVPVVGCPCAVCTSDDPRNKRTRSGVFVEAPEGNFVIDTSPELRIQLLRENVEVVHAAVFTHGHADHIYGLDDLRIFGFRLEQAIPLYCEPEVEAVIRRAFSYAFQPPVETNHKFATPNLRFESVGLEPFSLLGATLRPLRLMHGRTPVLGYRVNDVAFCTDVSHVPDETLPYLEGLDTLVLDALRHEPHPTHFCIEQAIALVERLRPRRAYFTHLSCHLDYAATNAALPDGVELAYDGLRIDC